VIYADILISSLLAAVLEIYSQHFYTSSSFNATESSVCVITEKGGSSYAGKYFCGGV
jgi:hypothetical protein